MSCPFLRSKKAAPSAAPAGLPGSPSSEGVSEAGPPRDARFCTTHWSAVLAARDKNSSQAQQALAELCRSYWYPLYAYVRRRGNNPTDAEDLTQGFFERLIEKDYFGDLTPGYGTVPVVPADRPHSPAHGCATSVITNCSRKSHAVA
jgi:hypothetical protein